MASRPYPQATRFALRRSLSTRRAHALAASWTSARGEAGTRSNDESGAVIILALIFLIAVSLIILALMNWVGTSLSATGAFANERSVESAATSAVNLAIQNSRYTYSSAMVNASPPVQCWGSTAVPTPSYLSVNGESIDVWCSMVWQPFSAQTRTITYSACLDPSPTSNPVPAATCALNPLLQAVVTFDDFPVDLAVPPPEPVPCTTGSCGQSLTQDSWQWNPQVPSVTSISPTTGALSTGLNNSGNPVTLTISGNGFVNGATVDLVQETGPNPPSGTGIQPTNASGAPIANVPTTPPNEGQGVIVPASVVANSESCAGAGNTNCTLQATVPAVTSGVYYGSPAGSYYFVTVTTPAGTSAYQAPSSGPYVTFAYSAPQPVVSSISVATGTTGGSIAGGTTVTINGPANGSGGFFSSPNFAAQVIFCSASPCSVKGGTGFLATSVNILTSNTMTAVSPAVSTAGPYFVQVATIGGTSTNTTDNFTYGVQVPIIFSLSPTTGGHGTTLTINGYNFLPNSTVGWVPVSNLNATPTNTTTATLIQPQSAGQPYQLQVTVPTLPTNNVSYVPVITDPAPYNGGSYPPSQPYNEPADEFAYTS